ncbi:hypothetical protein ACJJTC_019688 [Scirpophaga incertulas]
MSLIMTKAAMALKNVNNFQIVRYESHKPKKKEKLDSDQKEDTNLKGITKNKDVDLKKIRHEVVKFGMSGFDTTKKEEAKIALAVSLGAKPPKREYINYKELMAKRKQEKKKLLEDKQLMKSKSILNVPGKKKNKINNDVGHLLSSYGKIQKKELKNTDKNVRKKRKK